MVALGVMAILLAALGGYLYEEQQAQAQDRSLSSEIGSSSSSVSSLRSEVSSLSSEISFLERPVNETFQFVQASVSGLVTISGYVNSVAVNATFTNNTPSPEAGTVVGIASTAILSEGAPSNPYCCPVVDNYSPQGITNSTAVTVGPKGEFSSDLVFSNLNAGYYVVKLFVTPPNGTVLISPISYVYLQVMGSPGSLSVCGGQGGAGETYYDRDNGLFYVAESALDSVAGVNGTTNRIVETIFLPDIVGSLAFYLYDSGNRQLYVGGDDSDMLFAIDTETNSLVGEFPAGEFPDMVYDPTNGNIFGIDFGDNFVSVINGSTDKIIAKISGIEAPSSGAYDSKNNDVYVQAYNGTVFVVDGNTFDVVGRINMPSIYLSRFVYDPDNGLFYAIKQQVPYAMLMINATTNALLPNNITLSSGPPTKEPGLPLPPNLVSYDTFNKDLYFYNGNLSALDTMTNMIVGSVPVATAGGGLVIENPSFMYDSSNGNIYATEVINPGTGTVALLEVSAATNRVVFQTTPSGLPLGDLSLDPTNGKILAGSGSSVYILNPSSNQTSTLTLGTCAFSSLLP